jgi:hypothetical protein
MEVPPLVADRFGQVMPLGWGWGWGYQPRSGSRYGRGGRGAWRYGHYRPPVLIIRGLDGRPRSRTERGSGAHRPGDERFGGDARGGTARPRDDGPQAGDPRRQPTGDSRGTQPPSGGTVKLGKPRG